MLAVEGVISKLTQNKYIMFKGCVRYIFTKLFFMSKKRTCETRNNVFYFTSKALFILEIIKLLIFRDSKCHDIIKCLTMEHKTCFIE